MKPRAIIFDFDGVIADSEVAANLALAACLTGIGLPTSYDDSLRLYCGHNWQVNQQRIEAQLGRVLPADFRQQLRTRTRALFNEGFEPVSGARAFLDRTSSLPRAIASSSGPDYIQFALDRFAFAPHFGPHIYSADGMARGKPHPDIYLKAADGLGISPEACLAIEDSPVGATAAVAAGMHVIGLCVAAHIADRNAHADRLRQVGVHRIAFAFEEIEL
jgi:HAD superfamily hydrolase (TIGR01509 family)